MNKIINLIIILHVVCISACNKVLCPMPVKEKDIELAVNVWEFQYNRFAKKAVETFYSEAEKNDNAFVHMVNDSTVFVWTLIPKNSTFSILKIIKMNRYGRFYTINYEYTKSIKWIKVVDENKVRTYMEHNIKSLHMNSFEFLSQSVYLIHTPTLTVRGHALELDTISNEFVRNELQLYRDYVLPLENKDFKIVR